MITLSLNSVPKVNLLKGFGYTSVLSGKEGGRKDSGEETHEHRRRIEVCPINKVLVPCFSLVVNRITIHFKFSVNVK